MDLSKEQALKIFIDLGFVVKKEVQLDNDGVRYDFNDIMY